MKKIFSIFLIFSLSLIANADIYTFTSVTSDPDLASVNLTISTSDMDAKADRESSGWSSGTQEVRLKFTGTLSASDITKLKALFPSWTPDGF
jgi:hypothetical protein